MNSARLAEHGRTAAPALHRSPRLGPRAHHRPSSGNSRARPAPPCRTTSPAANGPIRRRDGRTQASRGLLTQASPPSARPQHARQPPLGIPSHPAPAPGRCPPGPVRAGVRRSRPPRRWRVSPCHPLSRPSAHPPPFPVLPLLLLRVVFIPTPAGDHQLLCLISCHHHPKGKKNKTEKL